MLSGSKYIKEVSFTELSNWDAKFYIGNTASIVSKSYPLKSFGFFAKAAKIDKVKIEDGGEYKILGVRSYGLGAYQNRISKGVDLKMKVYQQAKESHLFWCKVDTKNGAFGIITKDLADGLGSSNMTFAELDLSIINPNYLQLLFRSPLLHKYMDNMVTGSTNRKYIKFSELLTNIKIPLPSIEEQNELVAEYNNKITLAENQLAQATSKDTEIESYIFQELGVSIKKKSSETLLNLISFKDTSRWDVQFFFSGTKLKTKYDTVNISDCIARFMKDEQGKSLRRDTSRAPQDDFSYIGMEHVEKESGEVLDMPNVKGSDIKSQTVSIPNGYFIYGKLRPYLNKYWVNTTDLENIVCSSEFFVFSVKESFNQLFFKYVLASGIVQQQIAELFSGARMPRINEEVFMNIKFPMPPLEVQNEIATHIQALKEQIKQLRTAAEANRQAALTNFEQKIF